MDFKHMTLKERASYCQYIYTISPESLPKCSDNFNKNEDCGSICCGYCPTYTSCTKAKCKRAWIDPAAVLPHPKGSLCYVVLGTGQLVTGSTPCLISEAYDGNS